MTPPDDRLREGLESEAGWRLLVRDRAPELHTFLAWAMVREQSTQTSLRLRNRHDVDRCRQVLPLFQEAWWAVAVYSCFDSITGAEVVATVLDRPTECDLAASRLQRLYFPRGSVQYHRAQATLTGAKRALLALCDRKHIVEAVMTDPFQSFDERFRELRSACLPQWGRTTCYDALLRAGALAVAGSRYEPERAYLRGSSGPSNGFERVWGVKVTAATEQCCEAILVSWSDRWQATSKQVGVAWDGTPYAPGDFENALCVFHGTTAP
jgi:hypothetical protein